MQVAAQLVVQQLPADAGASLSAVAVGVWVGGVAVQVGQLARAVLGRVGDALNLVHQPLPALNVTRQVPQIVVDVCLVVRNLQAFGAVQLRHTVRTDQDELGALGRTSAAAKALSRAHHSLGSPTVYPLASGIPVLPPAFFVSGLSLRNGTNLRSGPDSREQLRQ